MDDRQLDRTGRTGHPQIVKARSAPACRCQPRCPGSLISPAPSSPEDRDVWLGHELRTPLTSIIGYLRLLDAEPGYELTPQQRRTVEIISAAAHRLEALADELTRAQDNG